MAQRNSSPEARKAIRQSGIFFISACVCCVLLAAGAVGVGCASQRSNPAPRQPVASEYHGQHVTEDYQWLEDGTNPAVRNWSATQNARARECLDHTEARPLIEARLRELFSRTSPDYYALQWGGGWLFYLEFKPPAQQPVLKVLKTFTGTNDPSRAELVLDPNKLNNDGSASIDWFVPSPDGKLVAVSLSEKGTENGTLYFFETATGRKLPDVVPGVNGATAGGSAAWNAEGTGIFYTRYPRHDERAAADLPFFQQVYFHQLGTATDQDRYEVGKEFPRIAEIHLEASPDHRWLLATVANGDGGDFAHWLRSPARTWRQIARFEDGVKSVKFGRDPIFIEWPRDEALYLLSKKDAPKGEILRMPLARPELASARVALAEGTNAIAAFAPSASGLYVAFLDGGPMELVFYDYVERVAWQLAPLSPQRRRASETNEVVVGPTAVQEMVVTRGDELFYRTVTHTEPFKWHRYDPSKDRQTVELTEFVGESPAEFGDVEAVRQFVKSKDGTRVPMTILRKKGTRLDGDNPTLLTGYGGYGISRVPNFRFTDRLWLDQGGIIAIANLRGGGEYGEEWHKAGNLIHKQNVFDDFIACAEFLIHSNYTRPQRLAIEGGSNGGLLMGAALTQRPELFGAVVSHVGIYDMLRVELDPNGVFNVTEYGTVKDPAQFEALRAYSPYHNVKNGTPYPPVLFLTGENDGRVNPAHSRKMTARLQAATSSKQPVLLRTSGNTGHGMGTPLDAHIAELTDVYAFLFDRLGLFYSEVDRGPWVGAVTPDSAVVKAKLARPDIHAHLVLSDDHNFRKRIPAGQEISETNHGDVVRFPLTGLKPDTRYFYAIETDGRLDRLRSGEFRTFPEQPASFTIAFASCARTGSTNEVFDRIREHRPLFYMNMGDFHYLNIATNVPAKFRAGYDAVLASPQQADLYRHIPFVYIWDDHDFGGNNVGRRSASHEAARMTYQEYVPHYPLAAGTGNVPIYQSFNVGRVKFILTDLRSERDALTNKDDAAKSMMGTAQKEWFKQELLSAKGKFPLICWVSSVPWLGQKGTNYYRAVRTNQFGYIHHTNLAAIPITNSTATATNRGRRGGAPPLDEDHWSMFATERREIADFIKSNHITGVCILHGDSHMLAADDGRHGDYATGGGAPIPVMCAAPLDQDPSLKGGPYSQGVYRVRKGEGCFGLLTVTDKGDVIDVYYSGRNNRDEEKISLKFSVPANGTVGHASSRSP
jgi:prolyl oligopeptidase